jgi:hypothetical protein
MAWNIRASFGGSWPTAFSATPPERQVTIDPARRQASNAGMLLGSKSTRAAEVIALLTLAVTTSLAMAEAPSRVFPYYEEDTGVLVLGQVLEVATRQAIVGTQAHYQYLLATGIPEADLGDGRLAVARLYCCGGSFGEAQLIWVYVPPAVTVEAGDVIEVRMGRAPADKDAGIANAAVTVRQKSDDSNGPCRWEPDNPKLWMRVLHCDGMEQDGWVKRKGSRKLWFKPGESQAPQ